VEVLGVFWSGGVFDVCVYDGAASREKGEEGKRMTGKEKKEAKRPLCFFSTTSWWWWFSDKMEPPAPTAIYLCQIRDVGSH
jgi:hypothetical protein